MKKFSTILNKLLGNRIFRFILSLSFWIFIWYVIAEKVNREVLVASPFSVIIRLFSLVKESYFWIAAAFSLLRITIGFLMGMISAILLAVLIYKFRIIEILTEPLLAIIKATPVASFIILAIVWLDVGNIPIFTTVIMALPIMCGNIISGIKSTDKNLLETAKVFNMKNPAIFKHIYIPSIMPYFKAGIISSIGLSWKAGIAAEVLCTPKNSIGKYLYSSKVYLETADLFAWTLVIIILSVILEKLAILLIGRSNKHDRV